MSYKTVGEREWRSLCRVPGARIEHNILIIDDGSTIPWAIGAIIYDKKGRPVYRVDTSVRLNELV